MLTYKTSASMVHFFVYPRKDTPALCLRKVWSDSNIHLIKIKALIIIIGILILREEQLNTVHFFLNFRYYNYLFHYYSN